MVPPAAAQRETGPTQWSSLWRQESSSCRKPRFSTEHCCRLHTLAIFCRPPGPASAAAPRTPSRVARGRARTRGLGVAPPAGGGAGAGPRSPRGGPGAARGTTWVHARPVRCWPGCRPSGPGPGPGPGPGAPPPPADEPGSFLRPELAPRTPRRPQGPRGPRLPSRGFLFLRRVPSAASSPPPAGHPLLRVPRNYLALELLGRNCASLEPV